MDEIRINIVSDPKGTQDAVKGLNDIKSANEKVEKSAADSHEHSKKRHSEQLDFNTKLTHSFEELAEGIIAAFAVEKIIEFSEECIKDFEAAEQATNDLQFAVSNLAKGTDKDFNEMIENSENLSKSLNNLFSPKEIQKADAALIRMKLSTEQVNELMPRLLDISAKTHKSLEDVSETFGKAISEGRTGALTQFGSKFKDTGDIVGNFNKVLEKTAGFAGGAADALDDFANKEQEDANKAEILREKLGSKLAPIWVEIKTKAFEATDAIVDFFSEFTHGMNHLFDNPVDFGKKYFNALTLNLFQLQTSEQQTAEKIKKIRALSLSDLLSQEMAWAKNKAGVSVEEQELTFKLIRDEIAARKKGGEEKVENEKLVVTDLSKLSNKQLEQRLEFAKDEDDIIGKYTTSGFQKEAARIEKEIALRKKTNDEKIKLEKEYQKSLDEIKKKDAEDSLKLSADSIVDEFQKKLTEEDNNFSKYISELGEREKKLLEIQKKGSESERKQATDELEKINNDSILAKKAHDIKIAQITEENFNKEVADAIKKETEKEEIKWKYAEIENKRAFVNGKKNQEDYEKEQKELEIASLEEKLAIEESYGLKDVKLQQEIEDKKLDLQEETAKKTKEKNKKLVEEINEISQQILESVSQKVEENIDDIDQQVDRQSKLIDEQKLLAEKGYANDLAFEEKKADDLEKQRIKEKKKLQEIKELEVFLNSVATYTEQGNNPAQAIGKALAILAATKAAEAVYAEEGGILGQTSERSYIGLGGASRMHRGGGDILLHAKKGEGIIPFDTMQDWGLTTNSKFNQFLKNPFNEKLIQPSAQMIINDNSQVVSRLESLEETIRNKKETQINWDEYNQMIETTVENGITKRLKTINLSNNKRRL